MKVRSIGAELSYSFNQCASSMWCQLQRHSGRRVISSKLLSRTLLLYLKEINYFNQGCEFNTILDELITHQMKVFKKRMQLVMGGHEQHN